MKNKQVCLLVTGMHRSGTSAFSGVLNLLGWELGDDLMEAANDNVKGFFENNIVVQFNDKLLKEMGYNWDAPFFYKYEMFSHKLQANNMGAFDFVWKNQFAHITKNIAIKDPRISLLLPFWKERLNEKNIAVKSIILLRHPLEIASSLAVRNAFTLEKAMVHWLNYLFQAEYHSRSMPRGFVLFDEFLQNPKDQIAKIATILGDDIVQKEKYPQKKIEAFLERKLKHHNLKNDDTALPQIVRKLYSLLERLTNGENAETLKEIDKLRTQHYENTNLYYHQDITKNYLAYKSGIEYYYAQLFLDKGNGFQEKDSIIVPITEETTQISFDVKNIKSQKIRFDPINIKCLVEIQSIEAVSPKNEKVNLSISHHNALTIRKNAWLFSTEDPNLYIDLPTNQAFDKIIISLRFVALHLLTQQYIIDYQQEQLSQNKKQLEINKEIEHQNAKILSEKERYVQSVLNNKALQQQFINEKEERIQRLVNKEKQKEKLIEEQTTLINNQRNEIIDLNQKVVKQTHLLENNENHIKQYINETAKQQLSFNSIAKEKNDLVADKKTLEIEQEQLQQIIQKQIKQVEDKQQALKELITKLSEKQKEVDLLERTYAIEKQKSEEDINAKKEALQELTNNLAKENNKNIELEEALTKQKAITVEHQTLLQSMEQKFLEQKSNINEYQQQTTAQQEELSSQKQQIAAQQEELNSQKQQIASQQEELNSQKEHQAYWEKTILEKEYVLQAAQQAYFSEQESNQALQGAISTRIGWGLTAPLRWLHDSFTEKPANETKWWLMLDMLKTGAKQPQKLAQNVNKENLKTLKNALRNESPATIANNFKRKLKQENHQVQLKPQESSITIEPNVEQAITENNITPTQTPAVPKKEVKAALSQPITRTLCHYIDGVEETEFFVIVKGWCFCKEKNITELFIQITQENQYQQNFKILSWHNRLDVYQKYNNQHALKSGFEIKVPKEIIGDVQLHYVAKFQDEKEQRLLINNYKVKSSNFDKIINGLEKNQAKFKQNKTNKKDIAIYSSSLGNYFFNEIQELIGEGLKNLGYSVTICDENKGFIKRAKQHIVVAPHEFFYLGKGQKLLNRKTPEGLILLNTEQPSSKWFDLAFNTFHKAMSIWDMEYNSCQRLKKHIKYVHYLPLGYIPNKALFKEVKKLPIHDGTQFLEANIKEQSFLNESFEKRPIDILFIGHASERRQAFFAKYANVFSAFRCYFHFTNISTGPVIPGKTTFMNTETVIGLVQRSKIVLNIHHGVDEYFEWHRMILQGVGQKALVVTEPSGEAPPFEKGRDYVETAIEDIPQTITHLLTTKEGVKKANEIIKQGFETLSKDCDLSKNMKNILSLK